MSSNLWILYAFSQINFIFQDSQENHSKTLNYFRNIFPAAAFEKQLSGIIHGYIFYLAINLNKKIANLLIGTPPSKYLQTLAFCTNYSNI